MAQHKTAAASAAAAEGAGNRRYQTRTARSLYRRVWSAVAAGYYDPVRLGDWAKWKDRHIGEIRTVDDALRAIKAMLASIGDEYTWLREPADVEDRANRKESRLCGVGLTVTIVEESYPVVDSVSTGSPAELSGIRAGDELVSASGRDLAGLPFKQVHRLMTGKHGSRVRLRFRRNGADRPVVRLSRTFIIDGAASVKALGSRIGYLALSTLEHEDVAYQVRVALRKLQHSRALVLDLRGNRGGYIDAGVDCASFFLESGHICTFEERAKRSIARVTRQLHLGSRISARRVQNGRQRSERRARQAWWLCGRPMAVLVDADTASAAELLAGALKDNGIPVFGTSRTAGKGIGQSYISMPCGTELQLTSFRIYTPSGVWPGDDGQTIRHGILPSHLLPAEERVDGSDAVLDAAVRYLKNTLRTAARRRKRSRRRRI